MQNFKFTSVCFMVPFLLNGFSCKNSENATLKNDEIVLIETIKTPIVGGAGKGGMKIVLNLQKDTEVRLDSIIYNNKSSEINEIKKIGENIWVESYFYNEKKRIKGKELQEYKAEGNSCELYYSVNGEIKNILVPSLEIKLDDILWK